MPEISRFHGIVIRMFAEASAQHHRPHFDAVYQEWAVVTVEFRTAARQDRPTALRLPMQHPMYRVTAFEIVGAHELDVSFDDGVTRRINFLPVLEGELFGPLRDLSVFNAVRIDEHGYTLVWPNGADFDPATLHDWPDVEADFIAMARSWPARR